MAKISFFNPIELLEKNSESTIYLKIYKNYFRCTSKTLKKRNEKRTNH